MKLIVPALIIMLCVYGLGYAQELKVPEGCQAVAGARPGPQGYADRIVHQKTGIELVLIPAGTFTMGTNDRQAASTMNFAHQVRIESPFYMGKTEVTNAQYKRFLAESGYEGDQDTDPAYDLYLRHLRGKSLMPTGDDYPIVWVSWKNAQAFCKWAGLALPSEAQWEYACRAGTTTRYYFGDDESDFSKYGWALGHLPRPDDSDHLTHQVAQKLPNAWGLYDMLGNVWEWVEDDYVYRYEGAPTDGTARVEGKMTKVLRGGSWANGTPFWVCGCGARFSNAPGNASNAIGFRVILPLAD